MFEKVKEKISNLGLRIRHKFTEHPNSVNETYLGHAWQAIKMSGRAQGTAIVLAIHACFPFLFKNTGTNMIQSMNTDSQERVTLRDDVD